MTIDENTRLDLRQWFETNMGERLARAVMEAMPPIDYDQLATKADVELLGRELRAEMGQLRADLRGEMGEFRAEIRGEMGEFRAEMRGEMGELRAEMGQLRAELRAELGQVRADATSLEGRLDLRISNQTRLLVTMQITTIAATVASMIGLASLVG
jgi:hypothetical protein